jgi:hypothetical protein
VLPERPDGRELTLRATCQIHLPTAVDVRDPDVAHFREGDLPPIRRPGRVDEGTQRKAHAPLPASIGVHHVEIPAAVLGVNTNTVLCALRLLRDEGLLEFRRGRGISVAGTPERGAVVQRARELVEFARHQGYRVDELVEIIEDVG